MFDMAAFIEDAEDVLADPDYNGEFSEFAKTQGIQRDDPRFAGCQQLFQSMKAGEVQSACLTIQFSDSDSEEKEPADNDLPAVTEANDADKSKTKPQTLSLTEKAKKSTNIQEKLRNEVGSKSTENHNDSTDSIEGELSFEKEDDEKSDWKSLTGKAKEFRDEVQDKLTHELLDDQLNPKSADDLSTEAATEDCNGNAFNLIREHCPCFKRIHIVMETYHNLLHDPERSLLWERVIIPDLIQSNQYGHQQLMDDFNHLQLSHIDKSNNSVQNEETKETEHQMIGQQMALYFMRTFQCGDGPQDMGKCKGNSRHFRARQERPEQNRKAVNGGSDLSRRRALRLREQVELRGLFRTANSYDVAFQEECDKIHSFFLQFSVHSPYWYTVYCSHFWNFVK